MQKTEKRGKGEKEEKWHRRGEGAFVPQLNTKDIPASMMGAGGQHIHGRQSGPFLHLQPLNSWVLGSPASSRCETDNQGGLIPGSLLSPTSHRT